jgi:hypothetical protein
VFVAIVLKAASCLAHRALHPKVGRTCIKDDLELLRRGSDLDQAVVLRVLEILQLDDVFRAILKYELTLLT